MTSVRINLSGTRGEQTADQLHREWGNVGLAAAVALAVDDLLPARIGFMGRLNTVLAVIGVVLLIGQGVDAARRAGDFTEMIYGEVQALRSFKVTEAIAQHESDRDAQQQEPDDQGD